MVKQQGIMDFERRSTCCRKLFLCCSKPWVKNLFWTPTRHFVMVVFVIIIIFYICLWAQSTHYSYYYFEDDDFNYGPLPVLGLPFNTSFAYNILLNSHSHTNEDDGMLSVEQNLKWHIAHGYNATIITAHNQLEPAKKAREIARTKYDNVIKVFVGMEWTNCRVHLNLIGIEKPPPLYVDPTDDQIKGVIQFVHEQGGLVIVNHYPWSLDVYGSHFPDLNALLEWGVDYFEVASGETLDLQTLYFAQHHNRGVIAGADMHGPYPVFCWTTINASNFSEEAIWVELKQKRTSFIYNAVGQRGYERWLLFSNTYWWLPLIWVGNIIRSNFYIEGHGIWSGVSGYCFDTGTWGLQWENIRLTLFWFGVFFITAEMIRLVLELFVWNYLIKKVLLRKCKRFPDPEEQQNLLMDDLSEDAELRAIN